jgi:hypothetical protein
LTEGHHEKWSLRLNFRNERKGAIKKGQSTWECETKALAVRVEEARQNAIEQGPKHTWEYETEDKTSPRTKERGLKEHY